MGFWSTLGKVGGAVAPFAAMAIPGVGPAVGGALRGVLGKAGGAANVLGGIGAGIGAASQASAQNRGEQFAGQMDYAQLRALLERNAANDYLANQMAREQEGRAGRQDAFKGLMQSQRVLSPGDRPQVAGPYNVAPRAFTDAERQGASAMSDEVMKRLTGGNPIAPVTQQDTASILAGINPELLKAGRMERLGGALGAGLSMYGSLGSPNPNGRMNTGVAGGTPMPPGGFIDPRRLGGPQYAQPRNPFADLFAPNPNQRTFIDPTRMGGSDYRIMNFQG